MSDPSPELQPAIVAALKASAPLQVLFAGQVKVFDVPPANAPKPYLTLADATVTPDLAECIDGAETQPSVHVWTLDFAQARSLAAAVQAALLSMSDLPSHRVVAVLPVLVRHLADADGRTAHSVVSVAVHTEPKS